MESRVYRRRYRAHRGGRIGSEDSRDDRNQQHKVHVKTFRALEAVTSDDDEITVVTEWLIERIRATGERPGSRAVRRRARQCCRQSGYEISDNEWLGA